MEAGPSRSVRTRISVVLVTWNQRDDALECIDSLKKTAYAPLDIFVVDNGSRDDTVASVRNAFPELEWLRRQRLKSPKDRCCIARAASQSCAGRNSLHEMDPNRRFEPGRPETIVDH